MFQPSPLALLLRLLVHDDFVLFLEFFIIYILFYTSFDIFFLLKTTQKIIDWNRARPSARPPRAPHYFLLLSYIVHTRICEHTEIGNFPESLSYFTSFFAASPVALLLLWCSGNLNRREIYSKTFVDVVVDVVKFLLKIRIVCFPSDPSQLFMQKGKMSSEE